MNRRSFFQTLFVGAAGIVAAVLPSPAKPKPQHTIDVNMASGSDTTFVNIFKDGKLVDCQQIDHVDVLKAYLKAYKNSLRINDNYF